MLDNRLTAPLFYIIIAKMNSVNRLNRERRDVNKTLTGFSHNFEGHEERIKAHIHRILIDSKKEPKENMGSFEKQDILQVRAFKTAYRLLSHLPNGERFITAICQTSDDLLAKADRAKVKEWEIGYLSRESA